MRILVLGGDGYLGWPTAMYLSGRDHHVGVVDNFAKRHWEKELKVDTLIPISTLHERVEVTWTGQRPAAETAGNLPEAAPRPGRARGGAASSGPSRNPPAG